MIRKAAERICETRDDMRGGTGRIRIEHFFQAGEFGAGVRLCARLTLPPGASIGTHEHINEDEIYIVIRGSGMLQDGEHRQRIEAGDAVLTTSGGQHAIVNDGVDPLELTAVIVLYDDAQT